MNQIPLFGSSERPSCHNRAPLAATADPLSSHLAAEEVTRSQSRPFTSAELARAAGLDRYTVARRLPDLAHDRLVERCPMRECTAIGRQAITWSAR